MPVPNDNGYAPTILTPCLAVTTPTESTLVTSCLVNVPPTVTLPVNTPSTALIFPVTVVVPTTLIPVTLTFNFSVPADVYANSFGLNAAIPVLVDPLI